jgi:predicted ATP-grasp superfamily ATP-dependent carboligase
MPDRILVTDVEERAALAVCRGLAAAGYLVSGVAGTSPAAGHWSRSVDRRYRLPNPRLDPEGFVSGLAAIAERGEHAALIPGVDAAVLAVSEHRERFEQHLRLGLPPRHVVARALDKPAFLAAAEAVGIGPPPSALCATVDEAAAAAARVGYPVVLKPPRSLLRDERRMVTSSFAGDERELRALAPGFDPPFTVQRYESGRVVSVGGVTGDGSVLGLCVARDLRMWPPRGGFTSASETIPPPEGLVERVGQLLEDLGWQGIFQIELMELADGRLGAIDFNPRPYGSLALALAAGVNLPALWADWLLGKRPAPAESRPAVRYRWEETELLNLLLAAGHGRLHEVAAVLRPRRGTTHAFFRIGDPAPLVARAVAVARSRLGGRV